MKKTGDNIISILQNEIEKNYSQLSIEKLQKIFYCHAKKLLNEYLLKIENLEIEILDIEYYYFSNNHQDIYVHKKEKQKISQKKSSKIIQLYVHKKNSRGGIDIVFGKNDYYGGILIRGISINGKNIIGINKVKNKIAKTFNISDDYKELQDFFDNTDITLIKKSNQKDDKIFVSIREGLNSLECKYKFVLYRFIKSVKINEKYDLTYKDLKDKSKILAINYWIFDKKIKLNVFKKNSKDLFVDIEKHYNTINNNCYLKKYCKDFKLFLEEKEKG
ncbi:hypothetical protein [Caminibacter mediatlanticus]|uniref:Uncharacterized protein n=1 Tax=Caminibacter mediatlanticus TB-2 TaxID=391592 RepID=A0AAI9AHS5_9BACT|nr:hypothetical protein [Caminibacter mediatlanticus]EDM23760.1 hypothetical protein CMTB2_00794 [Caminibacter mediatlanticus TB-2]